MERNESAREFFAKRIRHRCYGCGLDDECECDPAVKERDYDPVG